MTEPVDTSRRAGDLAGTDEPQAGSHKAVAHTMSGLFGRDSIYLLTWVLQIVGAAGVTPAITRLLGRHEYGGVAAATAVMQVLFVFAACGLQVAIQRWFAGRNGPDAAARLLSLSIVVAVAVTALAMLTGPIWAPALGFAGFDRALQYAVLWAGTGGLTVAALALLRSHDKLLGFSTVSLMQSMVAEGLALALVIGVSQTAESYLLGKLIAQVLALLLVLIWVRPRRVGRRDLGLLWAGLMFALPLVPAELGVFVLGSADRLMVQNELGEGQLGQYQVAYNIGSLPMLVLQALTAVWLPRFFAVQGADEQRAVLAASRAALQKLLAPVLIGMAVGLPIILQLWAPPEFQPLHLMLVSTVIIVSAVPFTAVESATRGLLMQSRTQAVAWSTAVAAAVNIGLNLVLIPLLGILGAAVATFIAYAVQHGMLLLVTGWVKSPTPSVWPLVQMLGGAAGAFAVLLLPTDAGGLVVRSVVAVGCLVWFGWILRSIAAPPA
jgi:O-antigen/teichoic acid export membrane protein